MRRSLSLMLALVLLLGCVPVSRAEEGQHVYRSETLMQWCQAFSKYGKKFARAFSGADMPHPDGTILYDDADAAPEGEVRLIRGETISLQGMVTVEVGTGMGEDEECWYVSLIYGAEAEQATILATGYAFVLATMTAGLDYATDLHSIGELLDALFAQESIAARKDGIVLIHQQMEAGTRRLTAGSAAYYDAFESEGIDACYRLE